MTRLTVLPGEAPDEIDLELLELGAVPTSGDRARIEAGRAGPLAGADAELAQARAYFEAHAPPLRASREPRWPHVAFRVAQVVALAAVALLIARLWTGGPEDAVRPMGGLQVEVDVSRAGGSVDPSAFHADDELWIEVQSSHDGYLDVWTQQSDDRISALVVALPVSAGERITLPGAVRLDGYAGEEWLLFRVTDQPSSTLEGLVADDLEPGRSWSIEVTRQP